VAFEAASTHSCCRNTRAISIFAVDMLKSCADIAKVSSILLDSDPISQLISSTSTQQWCAGMRLPSTAAHNQKSSTGTWQYLGLTDSATVMSPVRCCISFLTVKLQQLQWQTVNSVYAACGLCSTFLKTAQ